jgi:general secretion pathway protein I
MNRRGFTLIEVMVALFVIALGVGALLTTLVNSANSVSYLRDKSFAQWIAFNRVSEVRLASSRPQPGVTRDTVEYAGRIWRWEQEVIESGLADLMRVDVRVALLGEAAGTERPPADEDDELPTLGRATGFFGTALARPSGLTPEWSLRVPPGPPGGGGGEGR